MKKINMTIVAAVMLVAACAQKESNQSQNTTRQNQNQRGLVVNGKNGGQQGLQGQQRSGQGQQQDNLVNLERFTKDLGFYELNSKEIPQSIRAASGSVYQILFFTIGENADGYKIVKKGELKQREKEARENVKKESSYDSFAKLAANKQIDGCLNDQNLSDDSDCVFMHYPVRGTAFLAGDGATLWTSAKVVEQHLKSLSAFSKKSVTEEASKANLLMYVFDSKNNLVFDPYSRKAVIEYGIDGIENDYVVIKLSEEIGTPLKWANRSSSKINTEVFVLGYPACTGCEAPEGATKEEKLDYKSRSSNANANVLNATRGTVLFPDETVLGFYNSSKADGDLMKDTIISYTADSQQGMNGGPVLNTKGQVIAIHRGGKSRTFNTNNKLHRLSNGVIPQANVTGAVE